MKREYIEYGNRIKGMSISFGNVYKYGIVTDFLMTEVNSFSEYILEAIESVLYGGKEYNYFSGNASSLEITYEKTEIYNEFIVGGLTSYFMPTKELYELILEWIEMSRKYKAGELQLPIELTD